MYLSDTHLQLYDIISNYWTRLSKIPQKIPKISPRSYIFQKPFLRGLFLGGLIFGGAYLQKENCVSNLIGLAL